MMDIKNIPGKLKTTCSFCVWKFEKRNGQKTKMPFNQIGRASCRERV